MIIFVMPGNLALQIRHGLLAGLLALTQVTFAAGDDWFARPWQTDDGLLDSDVHALAQTPDGYMWVATETGLSRFDGVRFQTVWPATDSALPENNVDRLLVDSHDRFWMALHRGNVISVDHDTTRNYSDKEGLPKTNPTALVEDREGAIWIAFNNGIATRISHGEVTNFNIAGDLPPNNNYCRLTRDDAGRIWIAKDKYIGIFENGKFLPRATLERRVTRISTARGGGIWIFAGAELLRCREDGKLEKRAELPEGAGPTIVLEDRSGVLWIGTAAHGLYRYEGTELTAIQTSQRNISCLMEDREGNLWVGTYGGGLVRLRRRTVQVMSTASGAPFESLRSVCRDAGGNLWVVTWNREMWRQDANGWNRVIATTNSQSGGNFSCVTADPSGPVWIGSRSSGLYRFQNGTFAHWTIQEGLVNNQIESLIVSSHGDLWLTTDSASGGSGLQRFRDNQWHTFSLPLDPGALRALAEDKSGNIWIGSADGQLLRVNGDKLSDETPRTKSPPVSIRCLATTEDGSVWIGYAGFGVGRLKDVRLSSITTAQGMSDDYISQIIDDRRGWLWFGGSRGIFKVRQRELNDVADGRSGRVRSIVYERGEGMPGLQAAYETSPASLRDSEGCLWLASRAGLVAVHAERIRDNREPPPVRIDEVTSNGRPIALYNPLASFQPLLPGVADLRNSRARLIVPAKHGKLEFNFAALSFTAPENVQFKYRLDNVDEDWVEAGTQRSVPYPQLAAGDYQFHVIACNNSGVWNDAGATLNVTVLPFFWQRWWFRAAVLAGFTLSLIAVVRYVSVRRLQRQLRLMEQQAAVERERMRIARDIHDDLGDRLTTVAVLSGLVLRNRDAQPRNGQHEHLERISTTARQATDALDEIVWAINPRNDVLPNLINYIGQFAVEFLRTASVRCRLDLPDHPPDRPVPAEVRHNLFLVVKEALNNVVRHSGATEVHLRIIAEEKSASVVIEDNGRGITANAADTGGDGLRNMRQRMAEIGGEFKIEGRTDTGTRITLEFPWRRGE
jgi:signal transduction histidine kinase/ligand-binding sensor domain-containing protein